MYRNPTKLATIKEFADLYNGTERIANIAAEINEQIFQELHVFYK